MVLRILAAILKPLLLAPPVVRAGYLYATLVGLVWGAALSTGRIRRVEGLFVCRGVPTWAFSRGGSCIGGVYLTDTNDAPTVLEHEAIHRRQWMTYGLTFPLVYALAGTDPLKNRFEIEAGLTKGGYLR
ncbi:Fe-S oxidoreductase [Subtercola boreus]|uniref:Fe-S oxidoreductase n=1 Tax=Subtercola boreus TaxID=120213 RepID=A0A3E0WAR2_9MICO|nr:Fe-S oxidoreductase [Subtercola boreus]RFA20296.1 Fe-S oxidoreductase [Subtercola boreus]RFA20448.1 Fe-S oxidoreductase [Subtercola boreus]RFA26698.1 Fe-S oxidoreductase [Subtercola boreus]